MFATEQLTATLKLHLNWHGARLAFLALFLKALFQVRTVNLAEIATALNPQAKESSNYRRLQRFFADFALNEDTLARLVVLLLPRPLAGYTLTLDRTTWYLGKTCLNLLVLGIAHQGVAFPVCVIPLDKEGNSNTLERIAILEIFISLFGKACIHCLTADREFIGQAWFDYLRQEGISFRIRVKHNTRIATSAGTMSARALFQHLQVGQSLTLNGKRTVWGLELYVIGLKLDQKEFLILLTDQKPETALDDYAKRWAIETLFGILKSRGFRFEETHLTDLERIAKLLALLALATIWAFKIGEWLHEQVPLTVKKHGRLSKSIFRYGFNFLRTTVLHIQSKTDDWNKALEVLSCT
jgi:hypothetical protein